MKVGTDGTLLGAWARGGSHILDIGTGTGLIALMMAQRFDQAQVLGIDIDEGAVAQACQNAALSPFASRVSVMENDVCKMSGQYDAIVCNPPYFVDSLTSPDAQRTVARHAATLTYRQLMASAWRLLTDDGEFSVVIPFDCKDRLESEAMLAGFFKVRDCAVQTTVRKPPRRYLLAFRKHTATPERSGLVIGTEAYQSLMKDFYL